MGWHIRMIGGTLHPVARSSTLAGWEKALEALRIRIQSQSVMSIKLLTHKINKFQCMCALQQGVFFLTVRAMKIIHVTIDHLLFSIIYTYSSVKLKKSLVFNLDSNDKVRTIFQGSNLII